MLSTFQHKELLTSIRRYYSNAFTDRLKQDSINLFLGYYIPSLHSVPLWELESDIYLHSKHSKEKTTSIAKSLKYYQKQFNWDEMPQTAEDYVKDIDSAKFKMEKVKEKYAIQVDVLSFWWKRAIELYVQQRMCMRLSTRRDHNDNDTDAESVKTADTFERVYQPEKLTQFDRYFSRSWSQPSRLSHAASLSSDELMGHRKNSLSSDVRTINELQMETFSDVSMNETLQNLFEGPMGKRQDELSNGTSNNDYKGEF